MAGFDGRELLFQTLDQRVMAVSCTAKGDSFAAGKPRVWTETCLRGAGGGISYDLALDGKRLAAILADDANGEKVPTHLTFLPHFIRRAAAEGAGGEITTTARSRANFQHRVAIWKVGRNIGDRWPEAGRLRGR